MASFRRPQDHLQVTDQIALANEVGQGLGRSDTSTRRSCSLAWGVATWSELLEVELSLLTRLRSWSAVRKPLDSSAGS